MASSLLTDKSPVQMSVLFEGQWALDINCHPFPKEEGNSYTGSLRETTPITVFIDDETYTLSY